MQTASARAVFPVPDGPVSKIPLDGYTFNLLNISALIKGKCMYSFKFSIILVSPPNSSRPRYFYAYSFILSKIFSYFNFFVIISKSLGNSFKVLLFLFIKGNYLFNST